MLLLNVLWLRMCQGNLRTIRNQCVLLPPLCLAPCGTLNLKVLKTLKRMFITMLWECAVLLSAIHSNSSLATSLYCCLSNLTMLAAMLSYPPLKLALATSHVCIQSSS